MLCTPVTFPLIFRSSQGCVAVSIDICTALARFIGYFWRQTPAWVGLPPGFRKPTTHTNENPRPWTWVQVTLENPRVAHDIPYGPVLVFDLQGLRLRPRPVHQSPNTSKNWTGLIKDRKKPIKTGLDWLLVLTGLNWFKTGLSLKIRHIFISNVC